MQRPALRWYLVSVQGVPARVYAPAWCRRYYSRLYRSGICGGRMGQISGKATAKPCALFCGVGGITCMNGTKRAVNVCIGLYFSRAKQKPCTLSRCKAKEKPASVGGFALRCSLVRYKMFVLKYILFDKFGSSFRIKIYLLGYIRLLILTQSE